MAVKLGVNSWPKGSRTRETLERRQEVLRQQEMIRLSAMEAWLNVEWERLDEMEPGPDRESREQRWRDALGRYEKACDALEEGR